MRIFISYRRGDSKYVVDRIRDRLISAYDENTVFRDIESIPLGENFSDVLEQATSGCDVMLVVIGPLWAGITDAQGNKRLQDPKDFTRIEVESGLAHKEIVVIPVLVMNASMPPPQDIPESLADLLFRNATSVRNDPDFNHDMQRLIEGINQSQGGASPIPVQYFEPETVFIPEGTFWMGSDPGKGIPEYETPRHEISLPKYRIGKYPVTNSQYEEFISQSGRPVPAVIGWGGRKVPDGLENSPVMGVTWEDTRDYCEWLTGKTKRKYILPNEAQLEKACQGTYGCSDRVDNIYLWTCTLWGEKGSLPRYRYPWKDDERNNLNANSQVRRVVCRYRKLDGSDSSQRHSRTGQFPSEAGLPGARHSFRVVMSD